MLVIGVLTLLANGIFFAMAESSVQEELDKEIAKLPPGSVVDPVKLQGIKSQAVRETRLVNGGGIVVGLLFIGCATMVMTQPVVATVVALGLYIAATAVFGLLNPASLGTGLFIKIIVIVGLVRAVQAAVAHQKEQAALSGA
jgi:hypothetical protein